MVASAAFRTRFLLTVALAVITVVAVSDAASAQTAGDPDAQKSNASGLIIRGSPDAQKPDSGNLTIRQNVRRVVLDVVVSDSMGKPVSGLTAGDFAIAEDGKSQQVRSFDVHDFEFISDALPKHPASLPTNTFVNVPTGPERGPLYVLLLDILDMSVDDQPLAREEVMKFIRGKPLGTRFAVFVLSDGLYLVQGFTEDRNLLADAVNPKNPRAHIPRIFLYAENFQPYYSATRALTGIAKFLANFPGHKNLIWLSASFQSAVMPSSDPSVEGLSASEEIKETTDTLARGQIAVYPIDVRGAVVTHVSTQPGSMGMVTSSDSTALNASYLTERGIADATGGRAFYGTNDVAGALTEATEVGGHYYTLTYSPSNQNYNGDLRHIRVELAKRGYHLAYRRSYYGNPDSTQLEPAKEKRSAAELGPLPVARPADSLNSNMRHGAPLAHQLLFRAHIHTLAPPAKATPAQMASLSDQPAYLQERRPNHPAKPSRPIQLQRYEIDYTVAARYPALELAAAAFDADGKMLNAVVQLADDVSAQDSGGLKHEAIYRIQQQFDVPMSAVSVRLAVRDVATDNVGALEINLPLAPAEKTADAALHPTGPSSEDSDPSKPR
jgi:VWFA-related protein